MAWLIVLVAGALMVTGCDRLRSAVKEAAAKQSKQRTEAAAAREGSVASALDELGSARQAHSAAVNRGVGEIRQLGAGDFDSFVAQPGKVVLVDFYADWCKPCRMFAPILTKVVRESGSRVALGKVNTQNEPELAAKWRIRGIPDLRVFRDGKQVEHITGLRGENEVRAMVEEHLAKLPPEPEPMPEASGPYERAGGEPPMQRMEKDWRPPGVEPR